MPRASIVVQRLKDAMAWHRLITKTRLVAVGISGIIYGWIESFGPHIKRGG